MVSDATPLVRQWLLLRALSARRNGLTVREMADESGVGLRTIRRDLELLRQLGFPLAEETSTHGRKHWRLGSDTQSPPLHFTWDEAIALYLGRRHLEPLAGTQFWTSAQSSFRKIRATLGEPALRYLEKMAAAFHHTAFGAADYSRKAEIIDGLMVAIEDQRVAFITYQSLQSTEPVTYDVHPYGIVFHRQSLYLVAHAVLHDEVRHYKVDRIDAVELQRFPFSRPAEFDLQKHLADSFGIFRGDGQGVTVRVRFAAEVARYVEESRWHHSQRLRREEDGSLVAEFVLGDTNEIKRWILSFGTNAVVLRPKQLREEILADLREMAGMYEVDESQKT